MGNCGSNFTPEEIALRKKAKEFDTMLSKSSDIEASKVKLLLLGAGECGKSTIFKQMKLIYGAKFSPEERGSVIPSITDNIVVAMRALLEQTIIFSLDEKIQETAAYDELTELYASGAMKLENRLPIHIANTIKILWNDPAIQAVWARRGEFQIVEAVKYYMDRLDLIKEPSFLPSDDDMLHLRVRTSGILSENYLIEGKTFEIYDVGGQRNERKKWIHCFEGVTAVIFVVGLSEYDQGLFEDNATNRMVEALELFDNICNNVFFLKSNMILFLNKRDLFENKLKNKKICDVDEFSEDYIKAGYKDGNDYENGLDFFLKLFLAKNRSASRTIYHHVTCATDTSNVRVVLNACKDIILKENLKDMGVAFD